MDLVSVLNWWLLVLERFVVGAGDLVGGIAAVRVGVGSRDGA
jgi:hypothetical protein